MNHDDSTDGTGANETSTQAAYLHALEADLQLARALQQALLPQQYPCFPASVSPEESALRFYHRYQAASALSGDFFSVQPISDSGAGVFICDVMGHGVRPAMFTAMLRSLIEELSPLAGDPGQFLSNINYRLISLLESAGMNFFATAFYITVDAATGQLQYSNAGHPAPLHIQRTCGGVVPLPEADTRSGPALGLLKDAEYPVSQCIVAPGDVLLLFTDGLVEAKGPSTPEPTEEVCECPDEYGEERLKAALERGLQLSTPRLLDTIISEQQEFCGTCELEDDLCLVALEVCKIGEITPTLRDDLTGLFNRRYLEESLGREVHRAQRNGYPLSVIVLAFEEFDDWLKTDQEIGRVLLQQVGEVLRRRTRGSDIACYTSNGKFVLVLPEASLENSVRKAEQLHEAISQISSQVCPSARHSIGISKGVASYPDHGESGQAVVETASGKLC